MNDEEEDDAYRRFKGKSRNLEGVSLNFMASRNRFQGVDSGTTTLFLLDS
jgi:hypothetical protein